MKTLPDGYRKRTSSTVPFGYEEDGLIQGYLKPIEQELEILREVSEAIFHGEISLGIGVDWLEAETGRKISCYSSIGREMPTHSLLDLLIEIGSEIYLPKIICLLYTSPSPRDSV